MTFTAEPWGSLWAVMDHNGPKPVRIAQYHNRTNAEKKRDQLQEKWG